MIFNKINKAFSIIKQFLGILTKKFKIRFVFNFIAILIASLLETLSVSLLLPFVQAILNPEKLMQNKYVNLFVKFFNIETANAFIVATSVVVIVFFILKNIYQILCRYWQNKFRADLQVHISDTILTSYMNRPYSFFIEHNSSELLRNVVNDAGSLTVSVDNLFTIFTTLFIVLFMFIFLIMTEASIAIGLFLSALLVLIGPIFLIGKPLRSLGERIRITESDCYKWCNQSFQGIKEIIVTKKEIYFSEQYKNTYKKKNNMDVKRCVIEYIPSRLIESVCISVLIAIVCINIIRGNAVSDVMISKLAVFAMAAFRIMPSISALSNSINSLIHQSVALEAVYNNIENAKVFIANKGNESITFNKQIELKNLTFSYQTNKERNILNNANAKIKIGDAIGIKGSSGSGKTTCVDIILGLLKPQTGDILIDDVKLTEANVNSWRDKISYVPQTAYLIDDTIRANIAFGVPEKEIDNDRINRAMKEAMLYDYVESLPEKDYTVVGERGVQMSGGQRQRLSIARALYTNPSIIIFDEATSALDETTEKEIMESIDNLIGQKTLIIIAHRLSTLKKCNKIFEVADGKIIVTEN